jgi:sugar fermentation stimulation protein A
MDPFIEREPGYVVAKFPQLMMATVISRPNRFMVKAILNGKEIDVHIHDPGRLEELIFPGNSMLIRETEGTKTRYSVTFCKNGDIWTFNDSRYHSSIASLFIKDGWQREVTVGDSRLDFRYNNTYIEVKSATLVENGKAKFPDAPTQRGKKHLETLMKLIDAGYEAYVLFLIFNENAECFTPNTARDIEFSKTYYSALQHGVQFKYLVFCNKNGEIQLKNAIKSCNDK